MEITSGFQSSTIPEVIHHLYQGRSQLLPEGRRRYRNLAFSQWNGGQSQGGTCFARCPSLITDHSQLWSLTKVTPLFVYILWSCPITLGYILISLLLDNSCQSVRLKNDMLFVKKIPRKRKIILILSVSKRGQIGGKKQNKYRSD